MGRASSTRTDSRSQRSGERAGPGGWSTGFGIAAVAIASIPRAHSWADTNRSMLVSLKSNGLPRTYRVR